MALVAPVLILATAAQAAGLKIDHQPVACMIKDRFPIIEAAIEPADDVEKARLYFKAAQDESFCFVDMTLTQGRFEARLPKPKEKAGSVMGMSYRHAWGIVHRIAQSSGGKIVDSSRGGKVGGVTKLTPFGEELLMEYDNKLASLQSQFKDNWRKPSVTADGIVTRGNEILLSRRGKEPFKAHMRSLAGSSTTANGWRTAS